MEAIFLICGAGGPQLNRNPLGRAPSIEMNSCFVERVCDSSEGTAMRDSRKFSIVPEEQSKLEPYPFVFVEDDGSVRANFTPLSVCI